jgi:hypothetical protein
MKWIAFSIFVSSLVISFHYVWINRLEIQNTKLYEIPFVTIFNKWTGNYCVFIPSQNVLKDYLNTVDDFKHCKINVDGKVTFP